MCFQIRGGDVGPGLVWKARPSYLSPIELRQLPPINVAMMGMSWRHL
jgi:hypothetical protein